MPKDEVLKIFTHPSDMVAGVYCYRDINTGEICYIGKDSKLVYSNRHLGHIQVDSKNRAYQIDRELRANPRHYAYEVITYCTPEWLEITEELYIKEFKPKFNVIHNKEKK